MIKFGLQYNGKVLGFFAGGGDDAVYELTESTDNMWLVDSPDHANYVRSNSAPWYNAGYDTPINRYKEKDLTVVEVHVIVYSCHPKPLPSFEELMRTIYKNEPDHVEYVLKSFSEKDKNYSLYDYMKYLYGDN